MYMHVSKHSAKNKPDRLWQNLIIWFPAVVVTWQEVKSQVLKKGYGRYLILSLGGKLLVHNYAGGTDFVYMKS